MTDHTTFWRNQAQQNLTTAILVSGANSAVNAERDRINAESVHIANSGAKQAERAAAEAQAENERYRALLARPLVEILKENTDLKKAYEEQQKVLKNWVISQEAFRSLASRFKKELGISDEKGKELIKEEYEKAAENFKAGM